MSEQISACSTSLEALEQGQIAQARDGLRDYVTLVQETGKEDSRCNDVFIQTLSDAFQTQLDHIFLAECQTYLQQKTAATAQELVNLNGVKNRLLGFDGTLSTASQQCHDRLINHYAGLDWLARHKPRLEQVLIDCQRATLLLEPPVSRIRVEEAGAILRTAQVAYWIEDAMLGDEPTTQISRDLYVLSLKQAGNCLAGVEQQWLAESR